MKDLSKYLTYFLLGFSLYTLQGCKYSSSPSFTKEEQSISQISNSYDFKVARLLEEQKELLELDKINSFSLSSLNKAVENRKGWNELLLKAKLDGVQQEEYKKLLNFYDATVRYHFSLSSRFTFNAIRIVNFEMKYFQKIKNRTLNYYGKQLIPLIKDITFIHEEYSNLLNQRNPELFTLGIFQKDIKPITEYFLFINEHEIETINMMKSLAFLKYPLYTGVLLQKEFSFPLDTSNNDISNLLEKLAPSSRINKIYSSENLDIKNIKKSRYYNEIVRVHDELHELQRLRKRIGNIYMYYDSFERKYNYCTELYVKYSAELFNHGRYLQEMSKKELVKSQEEILKKEIEKYWKHYHIVINTFASHINLIFEYNLETLDFIIQHSSNIALNKKYVTYMSNYLELLLQVEKIYTSGYEELNSLKRYLQDDKKFTLVKYPDTINPYHNKVADAYLAKYDTIRKKSDNLSVIKILQEYEDISNQFLLMKDKKNYLRQE